MPFYLYVVTDKKAAKWQIIVTFMLSLLIYVFNMLSSLAVFWYQILLSPIYSCIHFQVWLYLTWPHLFYTKGVFAWDIITFVRFMHRYRPRIIDSHACSYPCRSWSENTLVIVRGDSRSFVELFPEQLQRLGKFRDLWKEEFISELDLGQSLRSYRITLFLNGNMIPTIEFVSCIAT